MSAAAATEAPSPSAASPPAKPPTPVAAAAGGSVAHALARIGLAVLVPWLVLAAVMPALPAPALPIEPASLPGAIVLFVLVSLVMLGYEMAVYWLVARPIVSERGNGERAFDHDRLEFGLTGAGDAGAQAMHDALKEAVRALEDREGKLKSEFGSRRAIVEAVAAAPGAAWLDRDGLFDRLTHAVDHMQSRIDGEYTTIAARVGWVLASQAFLLGAFVALANAERIPASVQQSLAVAIAFAGSVIAFVLLLGAMFAHALVDELKAARDNLETRLRQHFGIRRCGVAVTSTFHRLGHSATRYVPCLTYLAWVALTIGTLIHPLSVAPARSPSYVLGPVKLSQGWVRFPVVSPPFAPGMKQYPAADARRGSTAATACPDRDAAAAWVAQVVAAWRSRPDPTVDDALLLVGGADRVRLGSELRNQIDSNMALARERAETVLAMLIDATRSLSVIDRITAARALITVTGPRIGAPTPVAPDGFKDCSDPLLAQDRTVEAWLPGALGSVRR